ncbi:MAG: hypothetical protein OES13_01760 [Acidimicrobiia bacterium]|nr:hypothetical protein [Acidimicrobiia bacterium]
MTSGKKELIVGFMGVAGLVVLLFGLFTDGYKFMVGLVIAIGIWSVSGLFARYWDVPKWSAGRH